MRRCQRLVGHVVAPAGAEPTVDATVAGLAALPELSRRALEAADCLSVSWPQVASFADALTLQAIEALSPPPPTADDLAQPPDERAALVLAQMAVNFSYFPEGGEPRWWVLGGDGSAVGQDDEAHAMTESLLRVWRAELGEGSGFASGEFLAGLSDAACGEVFAAAPGAGSLPMLPQRAAALRELGTALAAAGGVRAFVAQAGGSAPRFCGLLATACPCFDDSRDGDALGVAEPLRFLKRAQLCAASLNGAGMEGFTFTDIEALTVFSDYRLPQLFRLRGMLHLSPSLAAAVDGGAALPEGGDEELAVRAATIAIGDEIVSRCSERLDGLTAARLDYFLWRSAVEAESAGELAEIAFHRTRTTDY